MPTKFKKNYVHDKIKKIVYTLKKKTLNLIYF